MPGQPPGRWLAAVLAAAVLGGCASGPLRDEGVATELTPQGVADDPVPATGRTVLWGGVIVAARNLAERTRIEIVAYPLDPRSQRPLLQEAPVGRFLAYEEGYLETAEYRQGRRITVRGTVSGTEPGRVGEADYTYPTVTVEALELWPEQDARPRSEPRFHFGIGIILSN
ncbi:MAG: Slp family lipoprotein [Halofilum sp. (in: g-proteobacteria)]|nr:Slp family lipoprotein [Halofilum sp. (in: g-proteobacteria)]